MLLLSVPAELAWAPAPLVPWLLLGTTASGIDPTGVRILAPEEPEAPGRFRRPLPLLPPVLWALRREPRMPSMRVESGGMARKLRMVEEEEPLSPLEARVPGAKPPCCGGKGKQQHSINMARSVMSDCVVSKLL
jgi:hypothetical protein